ncbi:UNVERIFIED_CONTAM: threonine/homoserine/homoserine lactone efflux protein [Brevibacillus sp. OAP136]
MMDFLQGLALGLVLQLSVGPVFFALVHRSLSQGWREGVKMAAGVTATDLCNMAASALGASAILAIPQVRLAVLWGGALLLGWFGWQLLRAKGAHTAAGRQDTVRGSFAYGFLLTLANPLTILFWSGMYGSLLAAGAVAPGLGLLLYSLGCATATFVFLALAAMGASRLNHYLGDKALQALNRLVGCALLFFALMLVMQTIQP